MAVDPVPSPPVKTSGSENDTPSPTGRWKRVAFAVARIYALVVCYLFFAEDGMVFLPQPSTYRDGPGYFKLRCEDGKQITAAYTPHAGAQFTLLYSHGNAEDLGENKELMQRLARLGFNVLFYDYHGYGTSEGKPGERTSELDITAAYQYLVDTLHTPPSQIIAYGRSVGGGPTMYLVERKPVRALILESTFTDPASVTVPVRLLPWVMFPSLDRITRVKVPVLVLHGEQDKTIPPSHGHALYEAAPNPKFKFWEPYADHDDFKEVAGKLYDKVLLDFKAFLEDGSAAKPSAYYAEPPK